MSFVEFLIEYYVYILIVLVLMIITIIGFLADKRDKKKKKGKKDANVSDNVGVNANNTNVGGDGAQPMGNIAPTPLQPQNLDVNMNNANMNTAINSNVNPNMGMNSGIASQNIPEQPLIREEVPNQVASTTDTSSDVNSLGYKPLDEQKPKIAPRPVEIPSENAMGSVDSNLGNVGVTPIVNPTPTPTPVAPNMNQTPVMEQPTINQTFNSGVGTGVTPSVQNPQTQASVDQTPVTNLVPETPVVNSWDVNPTPSVNPTVITPEPAMGQTVSPMPNTSNMTSTPMQPNVNQAPTNVGNNVSQPASQVAPTPQAQPQQQASGMNFVYGQETPTNANNQVNNNQDLWKL